MGKKTTGERRISTECPSSCGLGGWWSVGVEHIAMPSRELILHPEMTCPAARRVTASVDRGTATQLRLELVVEGDLAALLVPPLGVPERTDFLWQHTCFEAFVRAGDEPAYHELNLAPSRAWAIYGFRAYRELESIGEDPQALTITAEHTGQRLTLSAVVELSCLSAAYADAPLRIGLSAVLEEADGHLSYWSLYHPPGQADFHHADAFQVLLGRRA